MMTPADVLALLERRGALLAGHFRLSSGRHSERFIQKFRIFEDPPTAEQVCGALADALRDSQPQVVVSAAVGGIIPGYVVAKGLGVRDIFVEREDGVPKLRRGFALEAGERVAVVEDVMTTGTSADEVIEVVRSANAALVAIGAIVRRGRVTLPLPVTALLELEIEDWAPEQCPLCARDVPFTDPGSRRLSGR